MSAAELTHGVVVTGWGIVSPLGRTVPEFSRRMFAGETGIVDIRGKIVAEDFPVQAAGLVSQQGMDNPRVLRHLPPSTTPKSWRFAGLATEEALENLPEGVAIDAIVYANADGANFDLVRDSFRSPSPELFDLDVTRSESHLEVLARIIKAHGNGEVAQDALISVNNACVSSNQAIGIACHRIRIGHWTRALVGGVDARCCDYTLMNFHLLGALSTDPAPSASRPFSGDRSGFVRGEGAASLLLESREAAETRNAAILGSVTGYCATSDAFRLTDGDPKATGAIRAMRGALRDADCPRERVSAISAHGTSTRLNDRLETLAIKIVFGERAYQVPVTSLKSQVGHSTVAAGALEAVASLLMLKEQRLAPTINYREPDPECDLDYVPNVARPASLDAILSNNFGFGGQNCCVVFERAA